MIYYTHLRCLCLCLCCLLLCRCLRCCRSHFEPFFWRAALLVSAALLLLTRFTLLVTRLGRRDVDADADVAAAGWFAIIAVCRVCRVLLLLFACTHTHTHMHLLTHTLDTHTLSRTHLARQKRQLNTLVFGFLIGTEASRRSPSLSVCPALSHPTGDNRQAGRHSQTAAATTATATVTAQQTQSTHSHSLSQPKLNIHTHTLTGTHT